LYRAPEILLGSTTYTKGVDMWSIGCILGELLGGKPMFPGTSTMNQLDRIIEVTGRPSKEDIDAIQSEFAGTMLESLPDTEPRSLQALYPNASEEAIDLLQKLLMFNPDKRITAEEALAHPYVGQFHNPEEEISCEKQIHMPINDNKKLSVAAYREELYASVCKVAVEKKEVRSKKPKKKSSGTKKSSSGEKKKKSSTKKEGAVAGEKRSSTKKKKSTTTNKYD
jgi:mitogen-activated protein kinase 15